MHKLKQKYQVVIVGGGPVGLFLAIILQKNNIDCIVLERRTEPTSHSRSLGIHPVSLELMEKAGLAEQLINHGTKIEKGVAWSSNGKIGTLSFSTCPGPYPFVLSLPQYKTEQFLERQLSELAPQCLNRGVEVTALKQHSEGITITTQVDKRGDSRIHADFLVGCDGKRSTVRKKAGFSFIGKEYPDSYIMGDFSDNTGLGSTAGIYLCDEGLIESFPLPAGQRRWVVKTDERIGQPTVVQIQERVKKRINHDLRDSQNFMMSSFGVQRYISKPMARDRIFLAGDAAHIVSPIGGQGMNLGWLDAWELSKTLADLIHSASGKTLSSLSKSFDANRTKAAKKAIRRAELNMKLGRQSSFKWVKNMVVWMMLNTPLRHYMARIFTMRGLDRWGI